MGKEMIKVYVKVPTIGKPEDYQNIPVIKDGKAIGFVISAVEEGYQYKLNISLWQDIGIELFDGVPEAITFNE